MSGFFSRFFSKSTFEQGLVLRLLDQNQALLDRLLEREGIEPVTERGEVKAQASSVPNTSDDDSLRLRDEQEEIEEYAVKAASNPDLLEQAVYNSYPDNSPQWFTWQKIVKRAEEMMERVS